MVKILVVDDSRIFRKILRTVFEENGHEVIGEAGNGREALDLLDEIQPDLVTLDITMPVMDGLEALKQIKTKYPNVKVVMASAAGQKSKVIDALKYGADDFLQKPFEPDDITLVVSKLFPQS